MSFKPISTVYVLTIWTTEGSLTYIQILRYVGRRERIDFMPELAASRGLRLCVCDLYPANFMKDTNGGVVAVDFSGYSFLPPSFFLFAMKYTGPWPSKFKEHLIVMLKDKYPKSTTISPLLAASGAVVPYASDNIGVCPSRPVADKYRI